MSCWLDGSAYNSARNQISYILGYWSVTVVANEISQLETRVPNIWD